MYTRLSRLLFFSFCILSNTYAQEIVTPTPQQIKWQQRETTAFIHFTVNTFTGREWGDGTESPSIFNPTDFDAVRMVKTLKSAGFKLLIITAKHHDGFCLWPSAYTDHSVRNSPYKDGHGDIVKELSVACHKFGLKFGFYLSPWDRSNPGYGTPSYNVYYKNQLRELLTNYGKISEVWFDGARGEDAKDMEYDFYGYWSLVRELQPEAVMFSDAGPDVRWVGNEKGIAGETCWSTIDTTNMAPGKADPAYLNTGDPDGHLWIPAETDVSIRPGWFYHEEENDRVRSVQNLVDLYYSSVGRNSLLLLNIPPDKTGALHPTDVKRIRKFHAVLGRTFSRNYGKGKIPGELTDDNLNTFVTLETGKPYEMNFKKPITFDRIALQENIKNGQRCAAVLLEYWNGQGWKTLARCTTIGYKRLIRRTAVSTSKVRITILKARQPVELAGTGFYQAAAGDVTPQP